MRTMWTLLGVVGLILITGDRATAQGDARAIVKKAIEASGGAEALTKYKAGKISGKGTINIQGMSFEFEMDSAFLMPGKLKNSIELEVGGMELTIKQIINGDRAVTLVNGMDQPLTDTRASELKISAEAQELYGLTPMLDEKYKLTLMEKETTINDKPAIGIEVTREGWKKPLTFYFDPKSNLLVGAEREGLTPEEETAKLLQTFSDYKKVQGVMQPTVIEVTSDGKKFMSMTFDKIELLESLPAREFAIGDD